jgi:hypothetical protein
MALLDFSGFDGFSTSEITNMFTSTGGFATTITVASGGRRSTNGLKILAGAINPSGYVAKTLSPSGAGVVIGVAVYVSSTPGGSGVGLFTIYDGATAQFSLVLNSDFTLSFKRGTNLGTVVATSGATGFSVGVFFHVQLKVTLNTSTGTYAVRINGSSSDLMSGSGVNTAGAGTTTWTQILIGQPALSTNTLTNGQHIIFDDYWICDQSGSDHNDFLGDMRVDRRQTTANGTTNDFTPSTGSNYQNIDDSTPDSDSTYNASATAGHVDLFTVEDAPVTGAGISAVKVSCFEKKSDAGTCTSQAAVRHSGSNYFGASKSPSTAYTYDQTNVALNPGTSEAWVESDFNNAEFGVTKAT